MRIRLVSLAALAALLALSVNAFGATVRREARVEPAAPARFVIRGVAEGLHPGGQRRFPVTVTNPYRFRIRVIALRVDVRDARPRCRASNVTSFPLRRSLTVPPRGARTVSLLLVMAVTAPDACQGGVFPLSFRAQAVKA